jgi:hypothetical protein
MLCKFFKGDEKTSVWEGYCIMPIGPLPLWLDDVENAVNKEDCTAPKCACECYEERI